MKKIFQDGDIPRTMRHLELESGKPPNEYLRLFRSPRRSEDIHSCPPVALKWPRELEMQNDKTDFY